MNLLFVENWGQGFEGVTPDNHPDNVRSPASWSEVGWMTERSF